MLIKRSFTLSGHATSVALEPEFWQVLDRLARSQNRALASLINEIDQDRGQQPLASACRVFVVKRLNSTTEG